ncbi:hypothetical protein [Rubrivirga litoralis]|uniref:Por secretion system C-terminal sorting domain-containing protein n=1 Tax=Rubrivirga litoralis TaxID=3075598 RepID=A0ABU3BNN7_9BACT|nr:hypothetical protein [Rubrivirga sp. F394]MDT0630915.1 hypothetical protein [Rubrivirga sp. F394]
MNHPLQASFVGVALACALLLAHPARAQEAWESDIVYEGADGQLVYVSDDEGNRVPDFSRAGYRGGGVALPDVPAVQTVAPVEGDDTASIQAAIDAVGARTPDADGVRGAVVLEAGTYEVAGTLALRVGGVVLRGAGDGEDPASNTVLRRSGENTAPVVRVGRSRSRGDAIIRRDDARGAATITDDVVPIGARSFSVDRPERYRAGDPVVVYHPATAAWIQSVDGGGTADDPPWAVSEMPIGYARTVEAVDGATVTVDAPVFARLVKSVSPSYIYLRDRDDVIEEVGVEGLRIDIETASETDETQAENAVEFHLVENGWVRGVTALHFWHAGVSVQNSRYVTVRDSRALDPHSQVTGGRRYNFEVARSQLVLFQGNEASEARHAYVGNGETLDSGVVFLDNTSRDASTSSEAHRRWATGFLFDNHTEIGSRGVEISDRRIHLGNRGDFGTAHGWSCANCVVWNAEMNGSLVIVEKPPTAQNYAIGTQGYVTNRGPFFVRTPAYIEGTNRPALAPRSLYLRQLQDRGLAVAGEPAPAAAVLRLFPAAPNPATGRSRLRFEIATPGDARLAVYDVLGREVAVLVDRALGAGRHEAMLDARALPAGLYLARLDVATAAGATTATQPLTVVR